MELLLSGCLTLLVFALGAAVGSFLNVVVYRLPAGLSLLYPPSRCPYCLRRLNAYDNVPVLGWLWLKGRCRFCKRRISPRYPLVEAATGILFVLVFQAFSFSLPTVGYWAFFSWLLALALIDLDTLTLPHALTKSGLLAGLVFQAIWGAVTTASVAGAASYLMTGIGGAVVGLWLFDLIAIGGSIAFGQTAMGGGDAKLAAMMGAWLGWKLLLVAGFLACAVGAFAGGGGIALGVLSRRQPMPFGPFLAGGAVLATFFGDALIATYLSLFFPTVP
ncbi:MAG: prepilin peptidase [Synechococcales cyanobacterium M58_A2018_015]|nr:prepilin peptidase [Synechococcales cyanobacterium M58_A2018_015]